MNSFTVTLKCECFVLAKMFACALNINFSFQKIASPIFWIYLECLCNFQFLKIIKLCFFTIVYIQHVFNNNILQYFQNIHISLRPSIQFAYYAFIDVFSAHKSWQTNPIKTILNKFAYDGLNVVSSTSLVLNSANIILWRNYLCKFML